MRNSVDLSVTPLAALKVADPVAAKFRDMAGAAAGGAHRGIGALQLRSLLRCRAQSNMLASQLRLRQSFWRLPLQRMDFALLLDAPDTEIEKIPELELGQSLDW